MLAAGLIAGKTGSHTGFALDPRLPAIREKMRSSRNWMDSPPPRRLCATVASYEMSATARARP